MLIETIIVILIVAAAVSYLARLAYSSMTSRRPTCACQEKSCQGVSECNLDEIKMLDKK